GGRREVEGVGGAGEGGDGPAAPGGGPRPPGRWLPPRGGRGGTIRALRAARRPAARAAPTVRGRQVRAEALPPPAAGVRPTPPEGRASSGRRAAFAACEPSTPAVSSRLP